MRKTLKHNCLRFRNERKETIRDLLNTRGHFHTYTEADILTLEPNHGVRITLSAEFINVR